MIFEKLKKLIAKELNVDENKITLDTNLVDDLGADSLDAIQLVMAAEEEFDISIADEDAQKFLKVSDIVELIESKQK